MQQNKKGVTRKDKKMIIVSQKKTIITKSMSLSIEKLDGSEKKRRIMVQENCGKLYNLGIYDTKERAEEVLEEIVDTYKFNRCYAVGQKQAVYEMPEE
ncbi:MAG: hypothetical protein ACLUWN_02310 [Clostridia bacterium]